MLLRDGHDGLEVFLMRRVTQMSFAPGMYVFPGGRLEEADLRASDRVIGTADERGTRDDIDLARGLLVCGVRETFEEAGVLLATGARWADAATEDARRAVEAGTAIGEFLAEHDLVVDADAMPLWGHWITPEARTRRFDTRFYVAKLPARATASDISRESDKAEWITPSAALARTAAGEMEMMPPTIATLLEINEHSRVDDVLNAARDRVLRPLLPSRSDGEWSIIDGHTRETADVDPRFVRELRAYMSRAAG